MLWLNGTPSTPHSNFCIIFISSNEQYNNKRVMLDKRARKTPFSFCIYFLFCLYYSYINLCNLFFLMKLQFSFAISASFYMWSLQARNGIGVKAKPPSGDSTFPWMVLILFWRLKEEVKALGISLSANMTTWVSLLGLEESANNGGLFAGSIA